MLSFSKAAVEQEPYPSLKCEGRKKIRLSQTFVGILRGTRTEGSTLLLLLHLVRLLVKRFELKVSSISFGPFSVGERVALVVWGETTTVVEREAVLCGLPSVEVLRTRKRSPKR